MTPRQYEVLRWLDDERWQRPMDIGGTDASHHSATLKQLARLGFVDRQKLHSIWCRAYGSGVTVNAEPCGCKGSCRYRRSPAGRAAVYSHEAQP